MLKYHKFSKVYLILITLSQILLFSESKLVKISKLYLSNLVLERIVINIETLSMLKRVNWGWCK